MSLSKLKLNPEKTEFIVFSSKAQRQKISSHFPVSILGSLLHPVCGLMQIFHSLSLSRGLAKHASFRCVTSVELESISLLKWQSLLQMPWLVVVWTIVTLCSEVCPVSISTNCKVFRTPLLVLLQIIESMLMLHPFYRNSTGCLLGTVVFSKLQHLCINFCILVLLLISYRSYLLVVVPIVLGIVTHIINTLQFLLSIHQSSSQPNILAIVLPLMLLRSGMTSLKMFAVQHQLPPSERSLKHTCLQKPTHHSLPRHICVSLV